MSWIVTDNNNVEQTYDDLTDMLYNLISSQYEIQPYDIVILVDDLNKNNALSVYSDVVEVPLLDGIYTIGYITLALAELSSKMDRVRNTVSDYFYAIADALADEIVDAIVEDGKYTLFSKYTITYLRW